MSDNDTEMTEPMSKEEMIDILKGLVFGTFDKTTAIEREALDMAIEISEQQPCGDCISRQEAIEAVKKNTFRLTFAEEQDCEGHVLWSAKSVPSDAIEGVLLELPSVTPQPKTGHWISGHEETGALGITYTEKICSNCGWSHSLIIPKNYCPKCGTRMEMES